MFNTDFVPESGVIKFRKNELDEAHKDIKDKRFQSTFRVDVTFDSQENDNVKEEACVECGAFININAPFTFQTERGYTHFSCLKCEEFGQGSRNNLIISKRSVKCHECDAKSKHSMFFQTCCACGIALLGESVRSLGENVWHNNCFTCSSCKENVGDKDVICTDEKTLICGECITKATLFEASPEKVILENIEVKMETMPETLAKVFYGQDQVDEDGDYIQYMDSVDNEVIKNTIVTKNICVFYNGVIKNDVIDTASHQTLELFKQYLNICVPDIKPNFYVVYINNTNEIIKIDFDNELLKAYQLDAPNFAVLDENDPMPTTSWLDKPIEVPKPKEPENPPEEIPVTPPQTPEPPKPERICSSCNLEIKENPIKALEKLWHSKCFICFNCHTPIEGNTFLNNNGNPICLNCEGTLTKNCSVCKKPIPPTEDHLSVKDNTYHATCFKCSLCSGTLEEGVFVLKQTNQLICTNCKNKSMTKSSPN